MMAFSRFAAAAAQRYVNYFVAWEIWNEPDLPRFWPPTPRPDVYARLVSATCAAIKGAAFGNRSVRAEDRERDLSRRI
jgi:hypothetical protein